MSSRCSAALAVLLIGSLLWWMNHLTASTGSLTASTSHLLDQIIEEQGMASWDHRTAAGGLVHFEVYLRDFDTPELWQAEVVRLMEVFPPVSD